VTIEIPNWCIIGKWIEWNAPHITGNEWVKEKILYNCPVYYSKYIEY